MKLLLAKIVAPTFRKSLDKLSSQELPIKAMFQLKGIVKILKEELTKWDELQLESAKKWATKDENGKPILEKSDGKTSYYKMDHENMLQFASEMGELSRVEIEIAEVKFSDLGSAKLTTDDLVELEFLVEG
jgi:hypothetical protein